MLAGLSTSPTVTVPLTMGDDSAIRITGTRITLPVLLAYVRQGLTPEQIASEVFDTLSVADIHAVPYVSHDVWVKKGQFNPCALTLPRAPAFVELEYHIEAIVRTLTSSVPTAPTSSAATP